MKLFIYNNINSNFIYKFVCLFLLLTILLVIGITVIIPIDLLANNINSVTLEEASNIISINPLSTDIVTVKDKNISIFNPLIDLLGKCNSTNRYCPSYFIPNKCRLSEINVSNYSNCIDNSHIIKAIIDERIYRLQQVNSV